MKIAIESTAVLTTVDGIGVRLWRGTTESGIPVQVFVRRIAVLNESDAAEFERELLKQNEPAELESIPLRMIL